MTEATLGSVDCLRPVMCSAQVDAKQRMLLENRIAGPLLRHEHFDMPMQTHADL